MLFAGVPCYNISQYLEQDLIREVARISGHEMTLRLVRARNTDVEDSVVALVRALP